MIVRMTLSTNVARIQRDGYMHDWLWAFLLFNRVSEHVHEFIPYSFILPRRLKRRWEGGFDIYALEPPPMVPEVAYMLRAAMGCEVLERSVAYSSSKHTLMRR
jgi:hypothetical protein